MLRLRVPSSSASRRARRGAPRSGAFASTMTLLPPGRFTTRSGRSSFAVAVPRRPARRSRSARPCPAISTTRRSCISPQRPRVAGARSAVARLRVSARSCSWSETSEPTCVVSRAYASCRLCSSARVCRSNCARVVASGDSFVSASVRNELLFCARAAALISLKRSSQLAFSCWTRPTFSSAPTRSRAICSRSERRRGST